MAGLQKQAIERILDRKATEVGSMNTLEWHVAETILLSMSQPNYQGNMQSCSLEKSFDILCRLAEETAAIQHETPKRDKPKMDIYLLHAVLKRWNDCFRKNLTNLRPSQVCRMVEHILEQSKYQLFAPNIATYTIIMDGATSCPDPKERLVFTQDLLSRLTVEAEANPSLRPTVVTFGTVINALAKSNSVTMAEKAEGLLRRLQQLHQAGWPNMEPNVIVYTTVINAWANIGNAPRAEALLQEMYTEAILNGNRMVQPTTRTFNAG
jgi:hypothetical protein